jgi:DNA-binding XRE family transcriptional regulator
MSEPTKTPHTDNVELRFIVPRRLAEHVRTIVDTVLDMNREEEPKYLTPEEALPGRTPGRLLRGLRLRENLTQKEFGKPLGVDKSAVSAMERNKRPISVNMAKKIAEVYGVGSYRIFL